ncbi:DUF4307 domain-containing protein [Streptomyces iconiensis]|uniref:DUF4307 domain-containing protein n=1 Tax=Streptomyces iconiensis TaxID=1384038 RepID=A0ABT6ZY82_9ACTN|nr:DUF4307 domain-containing protein [Streptomyces iconiensis]MDJ1134027.1 DUF4307 domain-containing protein [Streptomyces iconiensis]
MVDLRQEVPEGRYGRRKGAADGRATADDARSDRRLKITGGVLGVLMLALIAWIGGSYISNQDVSGELIKFKVVSKSAVEVHLEVRKDAGVPGVCTLRARAEDGSEVGRKDVPIAAAKARVDEIFTMQTTGLPTSAELVGCQEK